MLAIIGGSGLTQLSTLAVTRREVVRTPYGEPSAPLLFRYSALTFNGHRIHYDRKYTMETEGYPGLIVHGPLQATLLIGLGGELAGRPLDRFDFRATKPLFDLAPFTISGRRTQAGFALWAADAAGERTMSAEAA